MVCLPRAGAGPKCRSSCALLSRCEHALRLGRLPKDLPDDEAKCAIQQSLAAGASSSLRTLWPRLLLCCRSCTHAQVDDRFLALALCRPGGHFLELSEYHHDTLSSMQAVSIRA